MTLNKNGEFVRRPLSVVIQEDLASLFYFFWPLAVLHNVACFIKPRLTDDPRGPWEIIYNFILDDIFQTDDIKWLYIYGTFFLTFTFFWTLASAYSALDFLQWRHFLYKYKIQPGKNAPPTIKQIAKIFMHVSFSLFLGIPMGMISADRFANARPYSVRYVPDVYTTFGYLLIAMLTYDCAFYRAHRTLHHKKLYKWIHKQHHEEI